MSIFGSFKKVVGAAAGEVQAQSNENKDILEAYCAAAALMATADGTVDDKEKEASVKIISGSKSLKGLFSSDVVERTFSEYCKKAQTGSGKQELVGELQDLARMDQGVRDAVYLVAKDICEADGSVGEQEQKRLNVVGKLLGVDPSRFALDGL
jgi:tellurite resistance protein TerB